MSSNGGDDRRGFLRKSAVLGGAVLGGAALNGASPVAGLAEASNWSAERRIRELGLVLPPVESAQAALVPAVRVGNLLFVSGQGPRGEDGAITGKVGADLTPEQGYQAARNCGLVTLAVVRNALNGDLDNVVRLVKVLGMVNAAPDFTGHSRVINGFSELLIETFGDNGRGARSAVGMSSLPFDWAVEVESIFEVR